MEMGVDFHEVSGPGVFYVSLDFVTFGNFVVTLSSKKFDSYNF